MADRKVWYDSSGVLTQVPNTDRLDITGFKSPGEVEIEPTATNGICLGRDNVCTEDNAICMGFGAAVAHTGEMAHANGEFSAAGDAQASRLVLRRSTTDATPRSMLTDGSTELITMPDNSVWHFICFVSALRDDGTEGAAYKFEGALRKDGAANPVVMGSVTTTVVHEDDATWDCAFSISAANPRFVVTGHATKNIRWAGVMYMTQVVGG